LSASNPDAAMTDRPTTSGDVGELAGNQARAQNSYKEVVIEYFRTQTLA
jgi:hypothetical protein